jgi:transposase-like protein
MTDTIKRYSEVFKREVVAEYEAGANVFSLQKKYGITGGQTIQAWIKKYGTQGYRTEVMRIQRVDEGERVKELEKQVKELERALGKMTLEKLKLESILDILQENGTDAVKKNVLPSSSNSSGKCDKGSIP